MKKLKKTIEKLKLSKILFILLIFLSNISLATYYYIKTHLGNIDFFQVYYHLINDGTSDGTFTVIFKAILSCIPFILVLIITEIFLFTRWKKYKVLLKSKSTSREIYIFPTIFSKYRIISSFILLCISIFILLNYLNFGEYLNTKNSSTNIYEKYYIDSNKVNINFKGKKRNLIYIYLESMESSLFSKKNNGAFKKSRIPELEKLAENNINFSHTNGLGGMYDIDGYTISALVSSTSSTPIIGSCGNECEKYGDIVPKVRTLGDVLTKEGYNVEYMQGTSAEFAGFKKYLKKHSNQKIIDYDEMIKRGYVEKGYFTWWGIEDKKLMKFAKDEISELAKKKEPFAFTLITMDTHFEDGYLDETCKTPFKEPLSNSYNCSSKKIGDLVSWIKKQKFYDDTMIVITGDHETMQHVYFKNSKDYQRTVYNVFINSKKTNINTKNRIVTNFDIYPTVLSGLGADINGNRIGFGTNLFSNKQTIPEIIGFETLNKEKNKSSDYYEKYINNSKNTKIKDIEEEIKKKKENK